MYPCLATVVFLATSVPGWLGLDRLWTRGPDPTVFQTHGASRQFDKPLGDVTRAIEAAFRAEGVVVKDAEALHKVDNSYEIISGAIAGRPDDQTDALKWLSGEIDGHSMMMSGVPFSPKPYRINLENVTAASLTKDGQRVWVRADVKGNHCVVSILAGHALKRDAESSRRLLDLVAKAVAKPATPKP